MGALPNRLNIRDSRGRRAHLQVTRHGDQRTVVISQWRDGVCVASTPLDVSELPALIGVLAEALGDAVVVSPRREDRADDSIRSRIRSRIRKYFRPTVARIVELPRLRVVANQRGPIATGPDPRAPNGPGANTRD